MGRVLVLADDLTGALDTGVCFHGRERAVHVVWDRSTPSHATVLAVSTETRDRSASGAADGISAWGEVLRTAHARGDLLYKKMDSALRGWWAGEIRILSQTVQPDRVIVCPAFPAQGRVVRRGLLLDRGNGVGAVRPALLAAGIPGDLLATPDAETDEDLERIVAAEGSGRVLWCGSAGLAESLSRRGGDVAPPTPPLRTLSGVVLVVVGSIHPAVRSQVDRLREAMPPNVEILVTDPSPGPGAGPSPDPSLALKLAERAAARRVRGGVVARIMSGGATAAAVLQAIGARRLEVAGRVRPGLALAIIRGGLADNLPVLARSGAFGTSEELLELSLTLLAGGTPERQTHPGPKGSR